MLWLPMLSVVLLVVIISLKKYDLIMTNLWFLSHSRIIELNGGQPPLTYKRFQTLISRLDPPEMPVETLSDTLMGLCVTPVSEDHGDKYGVPSLEELGKKTHTYPSTSFYSTFLP